MNMMKNDEELELLLGEIPHEISLNSGNNIQHYHQSKHGSSRDHHHHHHHNGYFRTPKTNAMMYGGGGGGGRGTSSSYNNHVTPTIRLSDNKPTCGASPVSGCSMQSDGSSSSLFSRLNSLSDSGSPTASFFEELKPQLLIGNSKGRNGLRMELKRSDESIGRDEFNLARSMNGLKIGGDCNPYFADYGTYQLSSPAGSVGFDGDMMSGMIRQQNLYYQSNMIAGSSPYLYSMSQGNDVFSQLDRGNNNAYCELPATKRFTGHQFYRGIPLPNLFSPVAETPAASGVRYRAQLNETNNSNSAENDGYGMYLFGPIAETPASGVRYRAQINETNNSNSAEKDAYGMYLFGPIAETPASGVRYHAQLNETNNSNSDENDGYGMYNVPQVIPRMCVKNSGTVPNYNQQISNSYSSSLPYHVAIHNGGLEGQNERGGMIVHQEKRSQRDGFPGNQESVRNLRMCSQLSPPFKAALLTETQEYLYNIAKDQQGCRSLQRVFDEGTAQDLQIVFNGIIDHVVELMMNPFGNYLIQKLLEVCTEEQRTQLLLKVTKPGKLIRISLNAHGTRVVQKLIETLKSRQQISLLVSALEPGFLDLINDLNGNHVIQRCLQCLTNEDSKFIFIAATKYCVDIATHPHGCCVLQRCITHSTGELRENLIVKISANGLLLAQDAFGNYVVQFILELKIPSATNKLVSQFNGNYIHLSAQKFSSHVVEKCLLVCNKDIQSKIIHELLSAPQFEQLLQDPHANYVVQTALKVSEGHLRDSLIEKIETHKSISRNSPYSKRIFTHKLLKK